jgi:hypothetical protein
LSEVAAFLNDCFAEFDPLVQLRLNFLTRWQIYTLQGDSDERIGAESAQADFEPFRARVPIAISVWEEFIPTEPDHNGPRLFRVRVPVRAEAQRGKSAWEEFIPTAGNGIRE